VIEFVAIILSHIFILYIVLRAYRLARLEEEAATKIVTDKQPNRF
jgi:hypothetical protein